MDSSLALRLLFWAAIFLLNCMDVRGQFTNGATTQSCNTLSPLSGTPSTASTPYVVVPAADAYVLGGSYRVFLAGTTRSTYTGVIFQARRANSNDNSPVGSFDVPAGLKILTCSAQYPAGTLTNIDSSVKNTPVTIMWTAPSTSVGNVEFVATVVESPNVYYENILGNRILTGPPIVGLEIGVCPNNITINAGAVANWISPTCIGSSTDTSTCNPSPGQSLTQTTPVTCACLDAAGGIASCTFQINVIGIQCPANVITTDRTNVQYTSPTCGSTFITPTAFCNPLSSSVFQLGVTTVTCTCFGTNSESCDFTVNIVGSSPCAPNPCQNGGSCSTVGNTFTCQCSGGFTGPTCIQGGFDACTPNPCQNGGRCSTIGNFFNCQCFGIFTGQTCNIVDTSTICINNPCLAPNECRQSISSEAGYTCHSTQGNPCQ